MTDNPWPVPGHEHLSAVPAPDPPELPVSHTVTTTPAVEWKVKAATAASYIGGVVGLALLQLLTDGTYLYVVPEPYTTLLAPLIPAIVTFVAGYLTAHTPRTSGLGVDVDAAVAARVEDAMRRVTEQLAAQRNTNPGDVTATVYDDKGIL